MSELDIRKTKIPCTKHQIPNKFQIPMTKTKSVKVWKSEKTHPLPPPLCGMASLYASLRPRHSDAYLSCEESGERYHSPSLREEKGSNAMPKFYEASGDAILQRGAGE